MIHSIRWRLVASYIFVTLLTVSLIGVLALTLVQEQALRQENDYLSANANAVAQQAMPYLRPSVQARSLQELAQTSAFLSNARIRILDRERQVVADSGTHDEEVAFVWVGPLFELAPGQEMFERAFGSLIPGMDPDRPLLIPGRLSGGLLPLSELPPGTEYTVIKRYDSPWGSRLVFEKRRVPATAGATPTQTATGQGESGSRSERSITVPIGGPTNPLGYVEMSGGLDFGGESLETARRAFLLAGLGASLLALLVGLLVSRGLAAPIAKVTAAAGRMSAGDLSVRAPVDSQDEIGQLASQFNQMAERLEASFASLADERDTLRRFIADASHELRTPITALGNFNELLQGPARHDPDAQAEFLAESALQIKRLEWITSNLLNLSRLEGGLVELDLASWDVGELLVAATSPFQTKARDQGIDLSLQRPIPPIRLVCDRSRLEMALGNLLDNALKFTPSGGKVTIGASQLGPTVQLWVRDTGAGIPESDLPHVFERFYRGQESSIEGSGLGLAIVQGIALAHSGRVTVDSRPGKGSRFTIELPSSTVH